MNYLLNIAICLLFSQTGSWQRGLDEIAFVHDIYFDQDATFFVTSSKPFGGDCTYVLAIDSIIDNEFYISGKYEGDAKCMENGAKDTIRLGILSDGAYKINYSFIDIHNDYQTETLTTNFTVSPQSIQQTVEDPDFTFQREGKNCIAFFLKDNSINPILYIYDTSGKVNKTYFMKKGTLKVSDLSPGFYLYQLVDKKRILYRGKFNIGN